MKDLPCHQMFWTAWLYSVIPDVSILHFKFLESLLIMVHDVVVEHSEACGVEDQPANAEIRVDSFHSR